MEGLVDIADAGEAVAELGCSPQELGCFVAADQRTAHPMMENLFLHNDH